MKVTRELPDLSQSTINSKQSESEIETPRAPQQAGMFHTVNVVIFAGGKFRKNERQTLHVGVNFAIPVTAIFIAVYRGCYFLVGVIFAINAQSRN